MVVMRIWQEVSSLRDWGEGVAHPVRIRRLKPAVNKGSSLRDLGVGMTSLIRIRIRIRRLKPAVNKGSSLRDWLSNEQCIYSSLSTLNSQLSTLNSPLSIIQLLNHV